MPIIITHNGRNARRLEPIAIEQEEYVQRYIQENPESLPLEEIDAEINLLILARELSTPSGSIDALGVDGNGVIYVIETKLFRNLDKRRVLAQALDYGAALWSGGSGGAALVSRLEEIMERREGPSLRDRLATAYDLEPEEVTTLLDRIAANASNGHFRFVVLMDRLDDRLKELISFVNRTSNFTIYGVELEFYGFDDHEIVIPKLYGAEGGKKAGRESPTRQTWDEAKFFHYAARTLKAPELEAIRTLYAHCRELGAEIAWGTGRHGSFNPRFPAYHPRFAPISVHGNGSLLIKLSWVKEDPVARPVAERLADGLRSVLATALPADILKRDAYLPITIWGPHVAGIIRVFEDCAT